MDEKLESEVEKILEIGVKFLKDDGMPPSMAFFYTVKGKFSIDRFDFREPEYHSRTAPDRRTSHRPPSRLPHLLEKSRHGRHGHLDQMDPSRGILGI